MKKLIFMLLMFVSVSHAQFWVTAYYATWAWPGVQLTALDYSIPTHIVYQAFEPSRFNPDPSTGMAYVGFNGGLTMFEHGSNGAPFSIVTALRDSCARHGIKMILGLGGVTNAGDFTWLAQNGHVSEYVHAVSDYCKSRGFKGVDFDWEKPAWSAGGKAASRIILKAMYDTLQTWNPKGSISVCSWPSNVADDWDVSDLNNYVDQINPMWYSFDMQAACSWGSLGGNVTYYQASLFDNGMTKASSAYWNVNNLFHQYLSAGVRRSKIGMGMSGEVAYANGATATVPGASPAICMNYRGDANALWTEYTMTHANDYHWDALAVQPWMGYSDAGGNHFYMFEDSTSFYYKTKYAVDSGMGGVMYFEYFKGTSARLGANQLLRGTKKALAGVVIKPPPVDTIVLPPPVVTNPCDSAYRRGYGAGLSMAKHDTLYVNGIDPRAIYKYFSTSLSDSSVQIYLKGGALIYYMGTKSSTTSKTPIRGYKP